jgi:hypothetical protein
MKHLVLLLCFFGPLCITQKSYGQLYPLVKFPTPNPELQYFYQSQIGKIDIGLNKIYRHDHFKELAQKHRLVAILPLEVSIKKETTKRFRAQQLARRALIEAKNGYFVLYASLLRVKASHSGTLEIQDITTTQNLLAENNISTADIKNIPPATLTSLLGVDAIIFCKIERDEKLVAEANWFQNLKRFKGIAGASAGTATVSLYDTQNELLWQFEGLLTATLGTNFDQTICSLGRKTASKIPYFSESGHK